MRKQSKIYVAGHTGLLGAALLKELQERYFEEEKIRDQNLISSFENLQNL